MVDGEQWPRLDEDATAAIRAALARVLASDTFRAAPQLSAFLTLIVDYALAGRSAELKGYTIAVEAFGRPADFDPQTDPIVRVEAGRLRKALAQYYAGAGAGDPVQIAMPVGAYIPTFRTAEPVPQPRPGTSVAAAPASSPESAGVASASGHPRRLRWPMLAGFAALVAGLATLGVWHRGGEPSRLPVAGVERPPVDPPDRAAEATASALSVRLPVIAVVLVEPSEDVALAEIARRFQRRLIDAVARFDDLVTVTAAVDPQTLSENADYVFEMNAARIGDTIEGFGRLRAVKDGRIVWTTSGSRSLARLSSEPELMDAARRVAIRLAEPFGIIHADLRQAAGSASPAMRCLAQAFDLRRTMQTKDHLAARTCIERLVEQDRSFHPGWSQLALLILDEYTFGLNPLPGSALDRALGAALNAVRLAPSSARGQQVMMDVLFARGQIDDALKAGQQALANNPDDPDVMADLGARYVSLNRPIEGLPLLERAIDLSSGHPPWYDFFAYLGARLSGASRLAAGYSAVFATDDSPFGLLGLALNCEANGDRIGLAAALRRLSTVAPLFGLDPRLYLARKGLGPEVVDHILAALGPALRDLAVSR